MSVAEIRQCIEHAATTGRRLVALAMERDDFSAPVTVDTDLVAWLASRLPEGAVYADLGWLDREDRMMDTLSTRERAAVRVLGDDVVAWSPLADADRVRLVVDLAAHARPFALAATPLAIVPFTPDDVARVAAAACALVAEDEHGRRVALTRARAPGR